MRKFTLLFAYFHFLLNTINAQFGFHKSIKLTLSNAITSSILINDTIYHYGVSVSNINEGLLVTPFYTDSNFVIINYLNNNFNKVYPYGGSRTGNRLCQSEDSNYIIFIPTNNKEEIVFMKYDKYNKLNISNKILKYRPNKNDKSLSQKIIPLADGYIIAGLLQRENDDSGFWLTYLKVDLEGNVIYWKTYGSHSNANDFGDATITSNGSLIISGTTNGINPRSFLLKIKPNDGTIINDISLSDNEDKVTSLGIKEKNNKIYIVGIHSSQPFIYNPGLMIYSQDFVLEKYTYLDLENSAKWYPNFHQFSYPQDKSQSTMPFQSTIDNDGNIYVVTKGFLYFNEELIDANVDEYISITKFNPAGDIVWETVDTIDNKMLGCNNKFIYPHIGSINVSNSGSIYITGTYIDSDKIFYIDTSFYPVPYAYYDSIAMKDTFAYRDTMVIDTITDITRGVGFVMKYNKDGCLVTGCKLNNNKMIIPSATWIEKQKNPIDGTEQGIRYKFDKNPIKFNLPYNYYELMYSYDKDGDYFEPSQQYYFREAEGKVYQFIGGKDELVYDFTLEVGNSIKVKNFFSGDSAIYIVDDIDFIKLNNGVLKKSLHLRCIGNDQIKHQWIQDIGDTQGILSIFNNCNSDIKTSLLCYSNEDEVLYQNPSEVNCWTTSTTDITEDAYLIYPNPSSNKIYFYNLTKECHYKIYDQLGRQIDNGTTEKEIDISIFKQGIYFLKLFNKSELIHSEKFIKM